MKRITIGLLSLSLTACMGGGGRRPSVAGTAPPSSATSALQGEWEVVGIEAQGQPRQATGRMTLDPSNNVSVRVELAPGEAGVAPPRVVLLDFAARVSVMAPGQLTYIAVQTRAAPEEMIQTASEPGAWRHFSVDGDALRLWQEGPDGRPAGVLIFRRVPRM